jgi:hypothetical protein
VSHLYTEILKQIEDSTLSERAANLLRNPSPTAQKAAVELLIDNPSPAALDGLWDLRRSLASEDKQVFFRIQVDEALVACVKLMPEWLVQAIRRSDPSTEPFAALVYLLVQLAEIEGGQGLWSELKETIFAKASPEDKRALIYVSESFKDADALARLDGSIYQDKDLVAPAAMRAWALLNPEKALASLEESPLDSSLRLGRSWWLPQLLACYYDRVSEILLRKIEQHEKPWLAAAVYDGRENFITPEILGLLLGVTGKQLNDALIQPEPENKDPLARPFRFLAKISRLDLLARFEALQGTPFEEALTSYMIRQGPNDDRWYRWKVWNGIAILQKIGGEGFTHLANHHLRAARTRLGIRDGLLLGIRRPDEETVRLVLEIAYDPERGGQLDNGFPLVQYEVVKALAALGQWREMVQGCLRLGLQTPKSLPDYLERHVLTDEQLADALSEIRSGAPSPGALLAVGFSDRPELAPAVRDIYNASERDSERALACLLALESLGDLESESLFLENLDSPKHSWVAVRALLSTVRTPRGDEALLDRLPYLGQAEGSDQQMLAMNLLILEDTRERAARLLWQHLDHHQLLFYTGDTLEYLAVLDLPDVKEFLRNTAFSDQQGTWHGGDRHAAIEGLRYEPDTAFQAAKALFQSDDADRLLCPETMLKINEEEALKLFRETLAATKDFLLIAAIGESLDRRSPAKTLQTWLGDRDSRIREGACFAMESLKWSQELEELVLPRLEDPSWDVRVAARAAFEALRLSKETVRLAEEVASEKELRRRWTLIDAALTIGYTGAVAGYGSHSWFGPMIEGQPYVLRRHALSKLEEKRKKFQDELAKRERS